MKLLNRMYKNESPFLLFFYVYIVCSILFTITEPRTFSYYTDCLVHLNLHNYPMQMIAGVGFIVSIITILSYRSHKKRGLLQKNKDSLILLISALLFIGTSILSSFVGYKPYIKPYIFIEFLLFLSVFFVNHLDLPSYIHTIKKILLLIIYGTLLFIIVDPLWSIQLEYNDGILSFFSTRLYGLTTNSNYTAPLMMLYVIFEMEYPSKSKWRRINILLSLVLILFTQSKTIWILFLVYSFIKIVHNKDFLKLKTKLNKRILLTYTTFLLVLSFAFLFVGYSNSLSTFTGRTMIWNYTVDAWQHNKAFGYGTGLWNEEMFLHYKDHIKEGWVFSHAHSQYYQTLGESGMVGVIFLFLYFFTLLFFGVKYARQTKGLSYYFALFLIIRGWTEPVFRHFFIDFNFFIHFIIFTYFMLVIRKLG